jgi:hypothetical protein
MRSLVLRMSMVMLGDAVNAKKAAGQAKDTLEVIDVAQLLIRSIKLREQTPDAPRNRQRPFTLIGRPDACLHQQLH